MQAVSDFLDVIVEPRYDTQTILAAGATLLTYFANPVGQGLSNYGAAGVPKTLADTNMDLAAQLPAGYNFVLLGFRVMPDFNITDADVKQAFSGAVFTFTIASKPYLTTVVRTIPAGAGPSGSGASMNSHGWPVLSNSFGISKKPLTLQQSSNFRVTITWPSSLQAVTTTIPHQPANGLPVTVFFDGFLKRIVQ